MCDTRYAFNIFGNDFTSPFELREVVLRIFKLHEVSLTEIDLFRLHFDAKSTINGKMNVIKEWVNVTPCSNK